MIPDYNGGSIVNLMASISLALGGVPRHAPLRFLAKTELDAARNIVLFIIDGLGDRQIREHVPQGNLAAAHRAVMTSVFPPTTASAITTTYTGATPLEHGLTGWHTYFSGAACVAATLPMRSRGDAAALSARGLSASAAFAECALFDTLAVPTVVVTDRRIIDSVYNRFHCGRARRIPYKTIEELVDCTVASVTEDGARKLVYAYWPEFDSTAHRFGPGSSEAGARASQADAAYGLLRDRLRGTDSLLIATADHGFLDTPPEHALSIEDAEGLATLLRLPLCGERRSAFCHVQRGRESEFMARAGDWLGERATVRPSQELVDEGWFGPGRAHPSFAERIGDVALLMHGDHTVKDWVAGEPRFLLRGNHGGTSPDEMQIPLAVVYC